MAQANYFKKRSPRSRSRLSYSSASEDDGGKSSLASPAITVPEGLRGLLNDISREVLLGQPSSSELYGFCASYLEQRLEERNHQSRETLRHPPIMEPQNSFERNIVEMTRQSVQSATLEQQSSPTSTSSGPVQAPRKKMLRREGTFSIYDSDSGVESSTTYAGAEGATSDGELPPSRSHFDDGRSTTGEVDSASSPAPTLEDAMQRLAETIKEFDSHAMTDQDSQEQQIKDNDTVSANMSQAELEEPTSDIEPDSRIVELVIVDRVSKRDGEVTEGGAEHKTIRFRICAKTGVEIISSSDDVSNECHQLRTKIPVHLVHSSIDRCEDTAVTAKQSSSKNIQGQKEQILPPIEVGLQLGHPEAVAIKEEKKAPEKEPLPQTAVVTAEAEAQTEKASLVHCEVQTHALPDQENDLKEQSSTPTTTSSGSQTEQADQNSIEGAKQPPRSELPLVNSESQTLEVQSQSLSTQTSIVDRSDEGVQTDIQVSEEFTADGVVAGQPTNSGPPLQERPPTLPGSSIDLPNEEFPLPRLATEVLHEDFQRTRTVSPLNLRVQDDVVARVLLEHVGTVFPIADPRQRSSAGVNYLDLSRLGDEGETPASDEIWLAVDGSGCQSEDDPAEDKFLTTDDTETYSIATDKLSTAATMAGYGNGNETAGAGPTSLLQPSSANLLSEQELADLGGCESFDAEAEATARLQGVLASELIPLHTTVQSTDKNVVNLTNKFGSMETVVASLCTTIESLQKQCKPPDPNAAAEDNIQIRRTSQAGVRINSPPNNGNGNGFKGGDVRLLDQLVARIEHLSSDVANMDASRQLREDNLLLRKELQTYREREIQMMNRLESLEKRLNDFQTKEPSSHSRRGYHNRSRRSSLASSRGTPELPPIEPRSRSVDSPKEQQKPAEPPAAEKLEPLANANNQSDSEQKPAATNGNGKLDKINVKQPLLSQSKTKKGVAKLRRTSNSSSNSSNGEESAGAANVKALQRRQPITPKLDTDYLQTEIQIQRSDNSILRQDLQVCKLREQQLYSRNQQLQEQLIEATSPRPGSQVQEKAKEKSEMNINVDFVTDGDEAPKAVFTKKGAAAKSAASSDNESSAGSKRDSSKERSGKASRDASKDRSGKPAPLKKDTSKDRMSVPKKKAGSKGGSTGSSGSSAEGERKREEVVQEEEVKTTAEKKVTMNVNNNAKNGVPKTKPTANGKSKTAKKAADTAANKKDQKSPKGSSSEDTAKQEKLVDDEEWKVTITSKHELETRSDEPNKVVIVKPKPQEEVKQEEAKVAKKVAKAKKAKVEKVKDARADPIPKPSMFPAARPPRGYCPPRCLPNASMGVTSAIMGGPMVLDGRPLYMGDTHNMLMTPGGGYRSGRASSIDSDPGDVISMVIKQEPRDSLVDAVPPRIYPPNLPRTPSRTPAPPPICQVRESPDGKSSSLIEAMNKCASRNDTACGIGDITEELADDDHVKACKNSDVKAEQAKEAGPKEEVPRDIVREYVLQEEEKIAKRRSKLPLKFRDLKPVSVAKNRAKLNTSMQERKQKLWRTRSWSTDKLLDHKKGKEGQQKLGTMGRHSMERLPTLSAFDEERIMWIKNLENDICMEEERRARSQLRRAQTTTSDSSSSQSSPSTCISRGTSPYNRLKKLMKPLVQPIVAAAPGAAQLDKIQHELSVQIPSVPDEVKVETTEPIEATDENVESKETEVFVENSLPQEVTKEEPKEPQPQETSGEVIAEPQADTTTSASSAEDQAKKRQLRRSLKKKEREAAMERRRSKSRKKYPPLSAECFLVSRGWQLDQTRLLRALDRLKVANFGRVQLATTMNRVVESIRPHLDAVIIHIGNQELIEAAYSVVSVAQTGENVRDSAAIGLSVAGSVATVMSRHIITAANQNRATQFIISLPLPVSLAKTNFEADIHYTELRRMFNATMKANCTTCPNVQTCENENLASNNPSLPPSVLRKSESDDLQAPNCTPIKKPNLSALESGKTDDKYILDNHQLTAAGMRKLARNWDNCLGRIDRASDGQLMLRRSSDSSETSTSGNSGSGEQHVNVFGRVEAAATNIISDDSIERPSSDKQRSGSASSSGSHSADSLEQRAPWKPC